MVHVATPAGIRTALQSLGHQLEQTRAQLAPDHARQEVLAYQLRKIKRAIARKGGRS